MRKNRRIIAGAAGTIASLFIGTAISNAAVLANYSNDFTTDVADFTTAGGTWTLNTSGSGTYSNVISASSTSGTTAVQVTNMAGQNFVVSTAFTVNTISGPSTTVGFGAFGSTASFAAPSYLADVNAGSTTGGNSTIRILELNSPSNTSIASFTTPSGGLNFLVAGNRYTLTLEGEYVSSDLKLTLTLVNLTTNITTTITGTDTTPLTGQFFGFRNRTGSGASNLDVSFDNFSVVIPEPASATLLAMSALLLSCRRRKNLHQA